MSRRAAQLLVVAVLSSEPMKNAGEHAAGINLFEWLAILFGIDTPGHRLPSFITDQTDRKLVGTLASNHCRTLDSFHDNGSCRTDWIRYFTGETHSACGDVDDIVEARLSSKFDDHLFASSEPFIEPSSRLLDADQAANPQDKEIVPGPEQVERPTILDQVRMVERKHPDQAQDRDGSQTEEAEKQPPVNVQAAIVNSLRGDLELVSVRPNERGGNDKNNLGGNEHLVDVGNNRQHAAAAEPGCNSNLRNHHGSKVRDCIRKIGVHHANIEQEEQCGSEHAEHPKRKTGAPVEKRLDQTYSERQRKAVAEAEGAGWAAADLHETEAPA